MADNGMLLNTSQMNDPWVKAPVFRLLLGVASFLAVF